MISQTTRVVGVEAKCGCGHDGNGLFVEVDAASEGSGHAQVGNLGQLLKDGVQPSRGQKVEDDTIAIEEGVVLSPPVQQSPAPDVDNLGVFITHDGAGGYQCRKQFRNGPSALDPRALAEVTYSDRWLDLEQCSDDAPDSNAVESCHLAGHSWSRAISALSADEDGRIVHLDERPAGAVEVADSQFLAGLAQWAIGVVGYE